MRWFDLERRRAYLEDLLDPQARDPGAARIADECAAWIVRAQDGAPNGDGGVSRSYAIGRGWEAAYPEVTGYIVPTMVDYARLRGDPNKLDRARRMIDWL